MKVAVLGCGPTGLVSAHAAMLAGADVTIYSKARKSHMFGAQYLHRPIPETDSGDPVTINYRLQGSIEDYRKKVYGDGWKGTVSPEDYEGDHQAFDIRRMYDSLWLAYHDRVVESAITPGWLAGSLPVDFDHIISTIPMPGLCVKGHTFGGQDIWVMGDADNQRVPVSVADNQVLCNGNDSPSWYRASNIFGFKTVEWAMTARKPPLPVARVTKPTFNNCTCWPDIVRLGRFGMWRKGILVHHAFAMTLDLLSGQLNAAETRGHVSPCPLADDTITVDVALQLGCRCG